MGTQVTYAKNLPEIPSEFIEPYAQRFLMMQIEAIDLGLITPDEAKKTLDAVEYFITCFSGIHARLAVSNEYVRFKNLSDENLKTICKKVFADAIS